MIDRGLGEGINAEYLLTGVEFLFDGENISELNLAVMAHAWNPRTQEAGTEGWEV